MLSLVKSVVNADLVSFMAAMSTGTHGRPLCFARFFLISNAVLGVHRKELNQTLSRVRKLARFESARPEIGGFPSPTMWAPKLPLFW